MMVVRETTIKCLCDKSVFVTVVSADRMLCLVVTKLKCEMRQA